MSKLGFAVHPGEILREEFLSPLGLKPYSLAKYLNVPRTRIERIVHETTPITPDTALRLSRFFGTTAEFWLNMQSAFDLAEKRAAIEPDLQAIARYEQAA